MPKKIEHKFVDGVECKRCSMCKEWLSLNVFNKNKNTWDNLQSRCKQCRKQDHLDNLEKDNHCNKQYYEDNCEKILKHQKQYQKENPEQVKKTKKKHCINNTKKIKEKAKQYRINNAEKERQRHKLYYRNNKTLYNVYNVKRKITKLNQTPENANLKEIQFLYDVCAETNELLGEPYFHVDHIHPISKGGLHHEENLQILESTLNLQKGAKWPLTADEEIMYAGVTF